MLCEIKDGPVFLSAVVASLISLVIFLSSNDFYVLTLSFVLIGFGRALRSGTLDAWFVENFMVMEKGSLPIASFVRPAAAGSTNAANDIWKRSYRSSSLLE